MCRVSSGLQHATVGRAERAHRRCVVERHALRGETVDMRGLNILAAESATGVQS